MTKSPSETALAPIPDQRQTLTASYPGWLILPLAAVATNLQIIEGRFQDVMTLPPDMMPTDEQRTAIKKHIASLNSLAVQTPDNRDDYFKSTLTYVTKMLLVLPMANTSELGAEAKGEAYMEALGDVPFWAVDMGIKRWYRGSCGKNERGESYEYSFAPGPTDLRRIARSEQFRVCGDVVKFENILAAIPRVDCSTELENGALAMRGLNVALWDDPVKAKSLTFDQAVELGRKQLEKKHD